MISSKNKGGAEVVSISGTKEKTLYHDIAKCFLSLYYIAKWLMLSW